MMEQGMLRNNKVVSTVMCNYGIIKGMEELGIEVIKSQVGDRYVIQDMLKNDCNLGGEQSGHLIFLDQNTTGDGLVCALQVLRIMIEKDSKLSDLAASFKRCPQACINVRIASKPPIENLALVNESIEKIEKALSGYGRVLVRYSGTENICRVMVEGQSHKQVHQMANTIAKAVTEEIGLRD
jgi:phosphoglucosamine mutase